MDAELDVVALRRIPRSGLTWISPEQWDAILAALERITELEDELTENVGVMNALRRHRQDAELRAERLEAAARAVLPHLPSDDPLVYGKVAMVTAAMDLCAVLAGAPEPGVARPTVVCLCGSTRFREAFERVACDETLAGRIVLTVNDFDTARRQPVGHHPPTAEKAALDELHLRKIDLADEVLILNVGGYIGESTRRELAYARSRSKIVRFLEPEATALPDAPAPAREGDELNCWVSECSKRSGGDVHVVLRRAAMPDMRVAFAACAEHISQFERVQRDPGYVQHWEIQHIWRVRADAPAPARETSDG